MYGTRRKTSKNDQESSGDKNRVIDDSVVEVVTGDDRVKHSTNKCNQGCMCQVCDDPDTTAMVQCDACDKWSHFACVGVSQDVENQSWVCQKCQTAKETQQQHSTSGHRKGLVSSKVSVIEERMQTPKSSSVDPAGQQEQRISVPKVVIVPASEEAYGKQSIKNPASSKASSQSRLKLQLMKLEEERAFKEAQAKKYRDYLKEKYELLEQMSNRTGSSHSESSSRVRKWVEEVNDPVIDGNPAEGATEPFNPKGNSTANHLKQAGEIRGLAGVRGNQTVHISGSAEQSDSSASQRPSITGHLGPRNPNSSPLYGARSSSVAPNLVAMGVDQRSSVAPGSRAPAYGPTFQGTHNHHRPWGQSVGNHSSRVQQPTWYNTCPPSQIQLAARQAVSKDLPPFSGNPEDWPIFVSTFESTTAMCGYSDEENMIRLQKCLKGKAYEAVKSCLMHPTNVTNVMKTLRVLYGQPEAIIHSLIGKINAISPIKEDKLEA